MIKETTVDSWQFLSERLNCTPTLALILGSGLSRITDAVEKRVTVEYAEIPGMGAGTVQGHSYQIVSGYLSGTPVVIFSGRFHYYEGYSLGEVTRPVRLAQALGAQKLILTNSAGSLHPQLRPGFYTVITDHLHLMSGNPLRGDKNNGRRHKFVPMTNAYDPELRKIALAEAKELDLRVKEGVYVGIDGPSYETSAEVKAFAGMGGDIIGMSTTPETIMARSLGMTVLGLSAVTNYAGSVGEDHSKVLKRAESMTAGFVDWVKAIVGNMG